VPAGAVKLIVAEVIPVAGGVRVPLRYLYSGPQVPAGEPDGTIITQSAILPGPLLTPTLIVDPLATVIGLELPFTVTLGVVEVGAVTVKLTEVDVPPPGAGENTVIASVPGLAISLAGLDAVSDVDDINVVGRAEPLTRTTEPVTNPLPVTVRVNAPAPAARLVGAIDDSVGAGFEPPPTVTVGLVASSVNASF
jgi:hypothetical protein